MNRTGQFYSGAVSIFIVVFTALLMTIVTVSFARLMLREQQRASSSDLSQSAYDAALAGVEDAKRALTMYAQRTGADPVPNFGDCSTVPTMVGATLLSDDEGGGALVGDRELQQAYTCVVVELDTDDYRASLTADRSRLIPLRGVGDFDRVKIEWFSRDTDLSGSTEADIPPNTSSVELTPSTSWPTDRPPVMEAQLIQSANTFTIDQFDAEAGSSGESNANTLFLYPIERLTDPTLRFLDDERINVGAEPTEVRCVSSVADREYACSATILLPAPVGGGTRSNAHLRLSPRYNNAESRISLYKGGSLVQFDGVQPVVDSTGRANDLFRRVSARVETGARSVAYPDAAVDVTGNFCKTFRITDSVEHYSYGGCRP